MNLKRTAEDHVVDISVHLFLTLFTIMTFYPLVYVVAASLSDSAAFMSYPGFLLYPVKPTIAAYQTILNYSAVWTGYKNTFYIVALGLMVNLTLTTLGAYFLSRKNVYWRMPITFFIIFTMYFTGGLIPSYLNVRELGLYDSMWSVILTSGISTYNMIIMRTNFATIPTGIEEAAEIDGANDFVILIRVILPLSTSILAVITLYYGVAHWNSWFPAMIYLKTRAKAPLQLVLREILIQNQVDNISFSDDKATIEQTVKYAIIVVSTLPILLMYPFLQKYFVKGVMIGSVKG